MPTVEVTFTRAHEELINSNAQTINELLAYRTKCINDHEKWSEEHKIGEDHRKRVDDAMKNLTSSNMLLAKAITDMNETLTRIVDTVDNDRPVIKVMRDVGTAWSINKQIFLGVVSIAAGSMAILTLINYLK